MLDVIVTFDLHNPSQNAYRAADNILRTLGFSNVCQGIRLPSTTYVGVWWTDTDLAAVRSSLLHALTHANIPVSHLLVASYVEMAFIGDKPGG